jgi:hypothetical protein
MREAYPWQSMRFREYRNTGPGAEITVPENRPQLTDAEAQSRTPASYLGDWRPLRLHGRHHHVQLPQVRRLVARDHVPDDRIHDHRRHDELTSSGETEAGRNTGPLLFFCG